MRKNLKGKLLALFLCFVTCFNVFSYNSVKADSITYLTGLNNKTRIVAPCTGGNGICQMKSAGFGFVRTQGGTVLINLGCCWQCSNCYTVMVTTGDPTLGQNIGYYCTAGTSGPVGYSSIITVANNTTLPYVSSTKMEGYRFSNN